MKKTLTVNLGGTVFNIDEDACQRRFGLLSRTKRITTNRLYPHLDAHRQV